MRLSWEQIELLSAAAQRRNARRVLTLASAVTAGMADRQAWRQMVGALKEQSEVGLPATEERDAGYAMRDARCGGGGGTRTTDQRPRITDPRPQMKHG